MKKLLLLVFLTPLLCLAQARKKQAPVSALDKLKTEAVAAVESRTTQAQQINDMLFSFSELGFQEQETFTYLTTLLEKEGLKSRKTFRECPLPGLLPGAAANPLLLLVRM